MNEVSDSRSITYQISHALAAADLPGLDPSQLSRMEAYLKLILRWNARTNLTSIRDEETIIRRHFVESIACARVLPQTIATLLDFGSGAGFPGIPVALCRPEISVTLAESQGKKAAFLHEAVRALGLATRVHSGRAEKIETLFDCVALRAVDRMQTAIAAAARLVQPGGWLVPLTTSARLPEVTAAAGDGFTWQEPLALPGSEEGIIVLALRAKA